MERYEKGLSCEERSDKVTDVTVITVTEKKPETETLEAATEAAKMEAVTRMVNYVSAETRTTGQNTEDEELEVAYLAILLVMHPKDIHKAFPP